MKKVINILCLISLISIIAGVVFLIVGNNSNQYIKYISDWIAIPIVFLALPLLGSTFSLAYNKDRIRPQTWLAVYGVMLLALIIILVLSWDSVLKETKDLSYAVRQKHLIVTGEATDVRYSKGKTASQLCKIDNIDFAITLSIFWDVKAGEIYTIEYLPNTKFIINIFDENGESLLMK